MEVVSVVGSPFRVHPAGSIRISAKKEPREERGEREKVFVCWATSAPLPTLHCTPDSFRRLVSIPWWDLP